MLLKYTRSVHLNARVHMTTLKPKSVRACCSRARALPPRARMCACRHATPRPSCAPRAVEGFLISALVNLSLQSVRQRRASRAPLTVSARARALLFLLRVSAPHGFDCTARGGTVRRDATHGTVCDSLRNRSCSLCSRSARSVATPHCCAPSLPRRFLRSPSPPPTQFRIVSRGAISRFIPLRSLRPSSEHTAPSFHEFP